MAMAAHLQASCSVISPARADTAGVSMRRGRGMSTSKEAETRPGREVSTSTRSARRTASRTLWVTKSTVKRRSVHSRSSSACSRSRVMASREPKGSSISSTSASWARARARATRCRMPPESSWGRLVPNSSRCTISRSEATRGRRSARRTPRRRRARATFPATVSQGNRAASWNMSAVRPSTARVPAVGESRPARRWRRVLFPHPEAPTRQTNSPRPTWRLMRSRAGTAWAPWPNTLLPRPRGAPRRRPGAGRCGAGVGEVTGPPPRASPASASRRFRMSRA